MADGLSSVRRYGALLATLILLAVATTAGALQARAATAGSIEGFVEIREAGVTHRYEGVTIRVEQAGITVDSGVSDSNGDFGVPVPAGTYTVVAVPPAASGLTSITEVGVTVGDGETAALNFRFEVVDSRVPVTGTVTDGAGNPVGGVAIQIYTLGSGSVADDGGTGVTAADGTYRIDVRPRAAYRVYADASGASGYPARYDVAHEGFQDFTSASVVDIRLPRAPVTVRVEDTRGDPVPFATVSIGASTVAGPPIGGIPSRITIATAVKPTNASGTVSFSLPPGTFSAGAIPPADAGLFGGDGDVPVPSAGPAVIILEDRPDPAFTRVTAHLEYADGTPMQAATLLTIGGAPGFTNQFGYVEFISPSGSRKLQVRGPGAKLPQFLSVTTDDPVELAAGGELLIGDVIIPTVETKLRILDPAGDPVEGARLAEFTSPTVGGLSIGPYPARGTSSYADNALTSDADGWITMWLLGDASTGYTVRVKPAGCGTGLSYDLVDEDVSFGAGGTYVVDLAGTRCAPPAPDPAVVAGVLRYHGSGVDGFELSMSGVAKGDFGAADFSTGGRFVIAGGLVPDDYRINRVAGELVPGTRIVAWTTEAARSVPAVSETTWDAIVLDDLDGSLAPLRVRVIDPEDRPVPGVSITTGSPNVSRLSIEGGPAAGSSWGRGVTGADGIRTLRLFATTETAAAGDEALRELSVSGGTYSLFLTPPPIYEPVTVDGVALPSNGAQLTVKLVRVQVNDPVPTTTTTTTVAPTTTTTTTMAPTTTTVAPATTTTAAVATTTTTVAPSTSTSTAPTSSSTSTIVVSTTATSVAPVTTSTEVPGTSAPITSSTAASSSTTTLAGDDPPETTGDTAAAAASGEDGEASTTTSSTTVAAASSNDEELPRTGGPGDLSVLGFGALAAVVLGGLAVRFSHLNRRANPPGSGRE